LIPKISMCTFPKESWGCTNYSIVSYIYVCTITTRLNRWALLQFSKLFSPRPSSHSHPSAQVEVHASFVGSFDTANAYTWFFIPIWHSIADIILSSISCNPTNPLLSSCRLLFFAPSRWGIQKSACHLRSPASHMFADYRRCLADTQKRPQVLQVSRRFAQGVCGGIMDQL